MAGTVPGLPGSNGRDVWVATLRRGDPMQPTTRWYDAPVLEADGVRLRPWRDEDVADLVDPDDASQRFMPAGAAPFVDGFQAWLLAREERMALGEGIYWCVADAATDRPLGHLQLFRLDLALFAGSGEVGYWLLPTARGRAVMATALELLQDFSFRTDADGGLGLHRLSAGTDADNQASNLVLRRAGFRLVGTEHAVMARPGEPPGDGYLWELLRDWPDRCAPVIEGFDVRLRPWRLDDVPAVVEACNDARTRLWLGALPDPYGPREAEDFVLSALATTASGETVHWAVADPQTDNVIGSVSLAHVRPADDGAELGYWSHPGARGRGVVRQAGWLAARHAVVPREDGGLGLRRVTLLAATANSASRYAAERIGFVHVGTERAAQRLGDGSVTNLERYDLLDTDLAADQPTTAPRSGA
jgi:RimJ/RimL family protein N-acetyltransferase